MKALRGAVVVERKKRGPQEMPRARKERPSRPVGAGGTGTIPEGSL